MSPSTGRSGGSQPGRRGRRRGRRGAGTSTGQDAGKDEPTGVNPIDSTSGKTPRNTSGNTTAHSRGKTSGNSSGGGPGKPSGQSAGKAAGKSAGRSRGRASGKAANKIAGKTGGKAGARAAGKSGGKIAKPGGRRLRTVDETSAGGLVVDAGRASAALIGRLDRRGRLLWSLPKGHIESGETPEQAAIREVAEETGIAGRVLAPLGTIDYWFVAEDRRVHKTVHHFLMEATGGELSDEDVEVTEVAWVPLGELGGRLAYADERRLVRLATEMLSESA